AILLGAEGQGPISLRTGLAMLSSGASPWLMAHINLMLTQVDSGFTGPDTFDSGLLDQELYWFFSDMVMARGLGAGLRLTSERLRVHVTDKLAREATRLRWCLLLTCLACLLGLALWHYAVIDELRRSLMIFYACQRRPRFTRESSMSRLKSAQQGLSLIEDSLVTDIVLLLAIIGVPAIGAYVVENKVPKLGEEVARFLLQTKFNAQNV